MSTAESEDIVFYQSLRDVIHLIEMLQEPSPSVPIEKIILVVHCIGRIDLLETRHMRPHPKHIALKYHHFWSFMKDKTISVRHIEFPK